MNDKQSSKKPIDNVVKIGNVEVEIVNVRKAKPEGIYCNADLIINHSFKCHVTVLNHNAKAIYGTREYFGPKDEKTGKRKNFFDKYAFTDEKLGQACLDRILAISVDVAKKKSGGISADIPVESLKGEESAKEDEVFA